MCAVIQKGLPFSLPAKYGGLGIFNPIKRCKREYENSRQLTENMVTSVKDQHTIFDPTSEVNKTKMKNEIKKKNIEPHQLR